MRASSTDSSRDALGLARALWQIGPRQVELRPAALPPPGPSDVLVRTLFSAISRGTERLVFEGGLPPDEYETMRAPLQEGDFPFPVKYGYCAVGEIVGGPPALHGRRVFVLHPHQDRFVAPGFMAIPLPGDLPPERAVLAYGSNSSIVFLLIFGAVWTMFTLGMIAMFWLSDKGAASLIDTMIIYQRG